MSDATVSERVTEYTPLAPVNSLKHTAVGAPARDSTVAVMCEDMATDIIFVSLENWDNIWRRNQFVCAELARRHPEQQILFVGLPRNVSNAVRRRKWEEIWKAATRRIDGFENIIVTHPLKLFPDSIGIGRFINAWMFRRHVKRTMKSLGIARPLLWLNPHWAMHMAGRMGEAAVIYDITDDWTSFEQSTALARRTRWQDEQLCEKANAVIVCSKRLREMKEGKCKRLRLIENGVNAAHYAGVLGAGPTPALAEKWATPVFGYTGTVHPERVDVELVAELSRNLKKGSLVFIGPDHLSKADRERLMARGNVHFIGPVKYAELPDYMRAIDVCIVPHRMTAFTESLNPIKLWEYLAAGKPIVSTDVAGFRDFPQLVRIATNANEFMDAMWLAQAEGNRLAKTRQTLAREHSWGRRVDAIEDVLAECAAAGHVKSKASSASEACVA